MDGSKAMGHLKTVCRKDDLDDVPVSDWFSTANGTSPGRQGKGPLIKRIREDFRKCGSVNETSITSEELARYWLRVAEEQFQSPNAVCTPRRRVGPAEKQVIALRVAQLMKEMDLSTNGRVEIEEWVHYMLLTHSGSVRNQINSLLSGAMDAHKGILQDLQDMFERADRNNTGRLTVKEIVDMYSKKLWHLRPGNNACPLTDDEISAGSPEQFASDIVKAMDLDGDECVTYPEFMAYCLGRRKEEVLLHLYDLSNGAAQAFSPYIVGQQLEGLWHTGLVAFGKEYYYTKDTVYDEPGKTSFGVPTRVVRLGYTLWRQTELHEFVVNELKPVFHRDTYDVVTNNCNHFTDRLCMYLLGKHVPDEVMHQPKFLLQSNFVRVLRPMLNCWLRDRIAVRTVGKDLPGGRQRIVEGERPAVGTIVTVHPRSAEGVPVLGRVLSMGESSDKVGNGWLGWQSVWDCCTAGQVAPRAAKPGASPFHEPQSQEGMQDAIWVQWFDIAPAGSPTSAIGRGAVRTELVPCSRLSYGSISEQTVESVYAAALMALGSSNAPIQQQSHASSLLSTPTQWEENEPRAGALARGGAQMPKAASAVPNPAQFDDVALPDDCGRLNPTGAAPRKSAVNDVSLTATVLI